MNQAIPVCYICDKNYFLPTVVSVSSLLEQRAKGTRYEIFILSDSKVESDKEMLGELRKRHTDCSITLVESAVVGEGKVANKKNHVTRIALLKYTLGNRFEHLDKLLYIDGDTIVQRDLSDLFNIDLGTNYLAAGPALIGLDEKYRVWHYDERLGVPFDEYFNTGVMLLNLAAFREDELYEKLLHFTENNSGYVFMDQDAFNVVCRGRVTPLSQKYNLMPSSEKLLKLPGRSDQSGAGLPRPKDASILHFAGPQKPWLYPGAPWSKYYLGHFRRSPARGDYLKNWALYGVKRTERGLQKNVKRVKGMVRREIAAATKKLRSDDRAHRLATQQAFALQHFLLGEVLKNQNYGIYQGEPREKRLIVSLTSIQPRLFDIATTIESIMLQTVRPDVIVLWLDKEKNSLENLPVSLKQQMERGLSVRFVEDIGPHTKLIPALKEYPDDIIITVDDDVLYPPELIERLYTAHLQERSKILCTRARHIAVLKTKRFSYAQDWVNLSDEIEGLNVLPLGVGGVLYPPRILDEKVFDLALQRQLAPKADDIWFKAMSLLGGVVCKRIACPAHDFPLRPFSQEVSLHSANVKAGGNERQIRACFEHFALWERLGTKFPSAY